MAEGTEPIRQDLDSIRDSMTDKMEQIESKVRGTVDNTVSTVKRTFDIRQQVDERPWVAMGVATAAGYVLGSVGGSDKSSSRRGEAMRYYPSETRRDLNASWSNRDAMPTAQQHMQASRQPQQPGFMSDMMDQFGGELNSIATAAVSAAITMLRDSIKQSLPQFNQEYERVRQERNMGDTPTRASDMLHEQDDTLRERALGRNEENNIPESPYRAPNPSL